MTTSGISRANFGRAGRLARRRTEWKTITFSFTRAAALPRYKRARLRAIKPTSSATGLAARCTYARFNPPPRRKRL